MPLIRRRPVHAALRALVLAVVCPAALAASAGSAWEWIERMNTAVRTQSYVGKAVLRSGDHWDTLLVVHLYRDGGERERVLSLSGPAREVLRGDGQLRVILPGQGIQIIEEDQGRGLLPTLGETAREDLARHYELHLQDAAGRVAGRETRVLRIEPRDDWRWGYRLELDLDTAMPLQLEVLGEADESLELIQFVDMQYPDVINEALLRPTLPVDELQTVRSAPVMPSVSDRALLQSWDIAKPPPGFRLSSRAWTRLPGANEPVAHWVYSDGLASVSIYANPLNADGRVPEARVSSGAVSTVRQRVNDMLVTAMGEVPLRTARHFSLHLQPVPTSP